MTSFGKRNAGALRPKLDMNAPGAWRAYFTEWQRAAVVANVMEHLSHEQCAELLTALFTGNDVETILNNPPPFRPID